MSTPSFDTKVDQAIVRLLDRLASVDALHAVATGADRKVAVLAVLLAGEASSPYDVLQKIAKLLKDKNKAYGNSALEPVRCFSDLDPIAGLKVRCDDKISRLVRGSAAGEDPRVDLMGYLVMLDIAEHEAA